MDTGVQVLQTVFSLFQSIMQGYTSYKSQKIKRLEDQLEQKANEMDKQKDDLEKDIKKLTEELNTARSQLREANDALEDVKNGKIDSPAIKTTLQNSQQLFNQLGPDGLHRMAPQLFPDSEAANEFISVVNDINMSGVDVARDSSIMQRLDNIAQKDPEIASLETPAERVDAMMKKVNKDVVEKVGKTQSLGVDRE